MSDKKLCAVYGDSFSVNKKGDCSLCLGNIKIDGECTGTANYYLYSDVSGLEETFTTQSDAMEAWDKFPDDVLLEITNYRKLC